MLFFQKKRFQTKTTKNRANGSNPAGFHLDQIRDAGFQQMEMIYATWTQLFFLGVFGQGFPFRETTTHVVWSFQMFGICGNISIWKRMGGPWWNWIWFHLGFRSFRFWIACENSPLVLLWHGISLPFNHTSSAEWWWNVDIDDNSKQFSHD